MTAVQGPGERWVLLARSGDDETLAALASCAVSAASLGIEVRVVWDGEALRRLANDRLEPLGESARRFAHSGRAGARGIFEQAGDDLPIEHFACSAAAELAGGAAATLEFVKEVVGWPTTIGWIRLADKTLTF